MQLYIDTETFAAIPALYADAAKTKPLPRVLLSGGKALNLRNDVFFPLEIPHF